MRFSAESSLYNMKEQLDWIIKLDLITNHARGGKTLLCLKEPLPDSPDEKEMLLRQLISTEFWVPDGYEIVKKK